MTYVEGDPGHIAVHVDTTDTLAALATTWGASLTLPDDATLGSVGHVTDHNQIATALDDLRDVMVTAGATVPTLTLPDTAAVADLGHVDDHNLIADALAILAAIPNGDLQFITAASFTAQSSVSINGCFSAAFDHYLVTRNLLGSTAAVGLTVRLRAGGVDDTAGNYRRQYIEAQSTSVAGARATAEGSWGGVLGGYTEATSCGFYRLWISNPHGTVRTTAWADASYLATGNITAYSAVGEHDLTTAYDGITFIPASGTITGSLYVYGVKV